MTDELPPINARTLRLLQLDSNPFMELLGSKVYDNDTWEWFTDGPRVNIKFTADDLARIRSETETFWELLNRIIDYMTKNFHLRKFLIQGDMWPIRVRVTPSNLKVDDNILDKYGSETILYFCVDTRDPGKNILEIERDLLDESIPEKIDMKAFLQAKIKTLDSKCYFMLDADILSEFFDYLIDGINTTKLEDHIYLRIGAKLHELKLTANEVHMFDKNKKAVGMFRMGKLTTDVKLMFEMDPDGAYLMWVAEIPSEAKKEEKILPNESLWQSTFDALIRKNCSSTENYLDTRELIPFLNCYSGYFPGGSRAMTDYIINRLDVVKNLSNADTVYLLSYDIENIELVWYSGQFRHSHLIRVRWMSLTLYNLVEFVRQEIKNNELKITRKLYDRILSHYGQNSMITLLAILKDLIKDKETDYIYIVDSESRRTSWDNIMNILTLLAPEMTIKWNC